MQRSHACPLLPEEPPFVGSLSESALPQAAPVNRRVDHGAQSGMSQLGSTLSRVDRKSGPSEGFIRARADDWGVDRRRLQSPGSR